MAAWLRSNTPDVRVRDSLAQIDLPRLKAAPLKQRTHPVGPSRDEPLP